MMVSLGGPRESSASQGGLPWEMLPSEPCPAGGTAFKGTVSPGAQGPGLATWPGHLTSCQEVAVSSAAGDAPEKGGWGGEIGMGPAGEGGRTGGAVGEGGAPVTAQQASRDQWTSPTPTLGLWTQYKETHNTRGTLRDAWPDHPASVCSLAWV